MFRGIVSLLISILQITSSKIITKLKNRRKDDRDEINDKIGGNNDKILHGSVEIRKNAFSGGEFPTPKASLALTQIKKAFTDTWILYLFLLKWYICIELDVSGYAIDRILSQLISNQHFFDLTYNIEFLKSYLGQW